MASYPQSASGLNYLTASVGPVAQSTFITASGSTNTKGAYNEYVTSTGFASTALLIECQFATNTGNSQLLADVATGAGGAEVVIIANLAASHFGTTSGFGAAGQYQCPIAIASSTRVAMRCQSSIASQQLEFALTLMGNNGAPGLTSTETVGANTATSTGAQVDPGGTADTKGSYTQITATTGALYQWLMLIANNVGHNSGTGARWAIDLATGAGGSEVVLVPDLRMVIPTSWLMSVPKCWPMLTYIAASTRLAVRSSCNINTATARLFDASVVGGTAPVEVDAIGMLTQSPSIVWPGGVARY